MWDAAEVAESVRQRVRRDLLARRSEDGHADFLGRAIAKAAAELAGSAGELRAGTEPRHPDTSWREMAAAVGAAGEAERLRMLDVLIEHFLDDMAAGFNPALHRLSVALLRPALALTFSPLGDGLSALRPLRSRIALEGPLDHIRALARRGTLVIAPTHSSHLDSVVLGLSLASVGLPPCVYAAGKHMFRNRWAGAFMRRVGAYRVDRGLHGVLYKSVLKAYSTVLLERGVHSVIFPGATRCRSNEIEDSMKLGLLGTAFLANRSRAASDPGSRRVHIIPATINYDVVLEAESLIHYHMTGRSKERIVGDELFRRGRLVESIRKLARLDQSIVIRFGEPLDPAGTPLGAAPDMLAEPSPAEASHRLAAGLVRTYQRDTVFMATHVTARAVHDLVVRRVGTADMARLSALAPSSLVLEADAVLAAIRRVLAAIGAETARGRLNRALDGLGADLLAARALRSWRSWHRDPPVRRAGRRFVVGDLGLLIFYRNRTSHLETLG